MQKNQFEQSISIQDQLDNLEKLIVEKLENQKNKLEQFIDEFIMKNKEKINNIEEAIFNSKVDTSFNIDTLLKKFNDQGIINESFNSKINDLYAKNDPKILAQGKDFSIEKINFEYVEIINKILGIISIVYTKPKIIQVNYAHIIKGRFMRTLTCASDRLMNCLSSQRIKKAVGDLIIKSQFYEKLEKIKEYICLIADFICLNVDLEEIDKILKLLFCLMDELKDIFRELNIVFDFDYIFSF